jgi:crossover junction endodeoxyribonuclease RusA
MEIKVLKGLEDTGNEHQYTKLTLPFPPSVNHYWRRAGKNTIVSEEGKRFRRTVEQVCFLAGVKSIDGRLAILIQVYPPDRRRRDLDNLLKALLDALQHGGAYEDDSQIDVLTVKRQRIVKGGCVDVDIRQASEVMP